MTDGEKVLFGLFALAVIVPLAFLLEMAGVWACLEWVGGIDLNFQQTAGIALLTFLTSIGARS